MKDTVKIGIIICDRYHTCTGGKCFRSIKEKNGAFSVYSDQDVDIVGYTTCGGCPGGNIENSMDEFMKNKIDVIHFATGLVVGYPPCPYIDKFKSFIETNYGLKVVIGTHPIPEKYYLTHMKMKTWNSEELKKLITPVLCKKETRLSYD